MNNSANVPAEFRQKYDRNRALEQEILLSLVWALEGNELMRLVAPQPSLGYSIDPYGDPIGVYLPNSSIVVWVSPVIDFHHPGQINDSNIEIMFSARYGHFFSDDIERILCNAIGAAGEELIVQDLQTIEPPSAEGRLPQLNPTYWLWLSQRRSAMDIDVWAAAVHRICDRLNKLRVGGHADPVPLFGEHIDALDVSRLCSVGEYSLTLTCPDLAVKSLMAAGRVCYLFAKVDDWDKIWCFDPDENRLATVHETVRKIKPVSSSPYRR